MIIKTLPKGCPALPIYGKRKTQTLHSIKYTVYLELQFSDPNVILKVSFDTKY